MDAFINIESIEDIKNSWESLNIEDIPIRQSWKPIFEKLFENEEISTDLNNFAENEKNKTIYPSKYKIFNAFNACSFNKLKIIIIGQDPYHSMPNQAQGFSFLVPDELVKPPSLQNILGEIKGDLYAKEEKENEKQPNLASLIPQGVLMMNCSLTVREKEAGSHMKYWQNFTNELIKEISDNKEGLIFMLWGRFAQSKEYFINKDKHHHILTAGHPSPLNRNGTFNGCKHFSEANKILRKMGKKEIKYD